MVCQNFAVADDESRAKEICTHFWPAPFGRVDGIPFAIFQGRAVIIHPSITQAAARRLFVERHSNMQETDARRVRTNDVFRSLRLALDLGEATSRFIELPAQIVRYLPILRGHLMFQFLGLLLKLFFLL